MLHESGLSFGLRDSYEALSYTWGTHEATQEIRVVRDSHPNIRDPLPQSEQHLSAPTPLGAQRLKAVVNKVIDEIKSSEVRFFVTPNLEQALRRFRKEKDVVVLWVDALCIDQENKDEKSRQVSRMAEIYGKARGVRIWLGEEDEEECQVAFDFARKILELEHLDLLVSKDSSPDEWFALAKLMRRNWFSRRWVVQELAMAQEAYLYAGTGLDAGFEGNDPKGCLHWDDFAEAVALFARESENVKELFRNSREYGYDSTVLGDIRASGANSIVDTTNNLFRTTDNPGAELERLTSLESLVSSLLIFEATDPRDIIYALLAIAKDIPKSTDLTVSGIVGRSAADSVSFTADYNKNILEVYKDFIAFCIQSSKSLDIVCRHFAPTEVRQPLKPADRGRLRARGGPLPMLTFKLPSWIPLLAKSPFGVAHTAVRGRRVQADGLVGPPDRKRYDAARGTSAAVLFGEISSDGGWAFSKGLHYLA